MKWLVTLGTDVVITLSARGKTNNKTTLFYLLDGDHTGSEKWTTDGVTVWRSKNAVEVFVNIREESDGDYVIGTLPSNLRPPHKVTAPIPQNRTGVKGTISKWTLTKASLSGYRSYTYLPEGVGAVGACQWVPIFDIQEPCEYPIELSVLDSEKVPITSVNAEGGSWDYSSAYDITPYPFDAGRVSIPLTAMAKLGKSQYSEPGTFLVYIHAEGGGYEEDIPVELTIWPFVISTLKISYYSDTGGYNIADGDDASFSFTLSTNSNVPADCALYVYDGETLVYYDEASIDEGNKSTASLCTAWANDEDYPIPWTADDVGNKTLRFMLKYNDGEKDITVYRDATVKITNVVT